MQFTLLHKGKKKWFGEKKNPKQTQGVTPADVSSSLNAYLDSAILKHQSEFKPIVLLGDFFHKSDYKSSLFLHVLGFGMGLRSWI